MTVFSDLQLDALTEIFNVGAGHAAASLSEIVGDEVKLTVPRIRLHERHVISADLLGLSGPRLGSVRQSFSGPFEVDAALLFREERALEIVQEMLGSQVPPDQLVDFEDEAMCELGNVILNASLSAICDMLHIELHGTLPVFMVDTSDTVIADLLSDTSRTDVLVLHMDLCIEKRQTQGYLVFLLSFSSLAELVRELDRFIASI